MIGDKYSKLFRPEILGEVVEECFSNSELLGWVKIVIFNYYLFRGIERRNLINSMKKKSLNRIMNKTNIILIRVRKGNERLFRSSCLRRFKR